MSATQFPRTYEVCTYVIIDSTASNGNKSAIQLLNKRLRPTRPSVEPASNFIGLPRIPALSGTPDVKGTTSVVGMRKWLDQLGHTV